MRLHLSALLVSALLVSLAATNFLFAADPQPYPGTEPLTMEGDIASTLVDGVDKFLLKKLDESIAARAKHWNYDLANSEAYTKSVEPNRKRLAHILGVRDARVPFAGPELVTTTARDAIVGKTATYDIFAIRWPVLAAPGPQGTSVVSIFGEGLLLQPRGKAPIAQVVAIPDADQTPEQLAGLSPGIPADQQFARMLAEQGCRVVVPMLINREMSKRNGGANLTNREYLYRPAFELGRHLIGYELQKVLAAIDWFAKEQEGKKTNIGVMGYGEGGMLALYAGALDTRIGATSVSGYFGNRQEIWSQPIDRNVFGLLDQFGDAELLTLIYPRSMQLIVGKSPIVELPSQGGAPAKLVRATRDQGQQEMLRAKTLVPGLKSGEKANMSTVFPPETDEHIQKPEGITAFLKLLGIEVSDRVGDAPEPVGSAVDPGARQARQMGEMDRHSQALLVESPYVRTEFMKKLDTTNLETYTKTVEEYREHFRRETIGWFDDKRMPFSPRSRKSYDTEKYTGYEVVLDVFPDVIAYGILLVPKNIAEGEKRPVVVCQHGLEGRPQDIVKGDHPAYHDFAAKLAERGFITFSPQNLYIFRDRFRTLQRKANPIGKTLFSVIIPQHQQIVDWLKTLPNVDSKRIAFYGLSYGGKSAMRIPPLVPDYCLSICSADFNEWVWKNASTRARHSYVWTMEYEIFEFDLGSTFNYAEMAALICPRPFMVERGHFDGVAPDETVGYEFAKVQNLYAARLKQPSENCQIEWFVGPHTINGKGTYSFLHKHLKWPEPKE